MMYSPARSRNPLKKHMVALPSTRVNLHGKDARKGHVEFSREALSAEPIRLDLKEHGAFPTGCRLTYDHLHRPRVARIGIWTEPDQSL